MSPDLQKGTVFAKTSQKKVLFTFSYYIDTTMHFVLYVY